MVVILPQPAKLFIDTLEALIYYPNEIDQTIKDIYEQNKQEFELFLSFLEKEIKEDWKIAKFSLPLNENFINEIEKELDKIPILHNQIIENAQKIKVEESLTEEDKKLTENILINLVELIKIRNLIAQILSNQKLLSPFPIIDRFLKIFWSYIENIKNLENFPIELLIEYLFSTFKLIINTEEQIKIEKELVKKLKDKERLEKIIDEQEQFIEAIKYALGAAYELISGNINLSDDPNLPSKIFTQINQASNGLFVLEKNKKINITDLLENFENLTEDEKIYTVNFLKNHLNSTFLNPEFILFINTENISKIENLIQILRDENINELIKENKQIIIDSINEIDNLEPNPNSSTRQIELANSFTLFITNNLPLTTFVNIIANLKNIVIIFTAINILENSQKIEYFTELIENLIFYSIRYSIYKSNLEELYITFLNFSVIYKEIDKIIQEVINKKVICPSCKAENDFLNLKCVNCNFKFSETIEKLLIINLDRSLPIISNYVINFIDNYFIKKDLEATIYQLEKTIEELNKINQLLTKANSQNQEIEIIENLVNHLENIREIVLQNESEKVIPELVNFLEQAQLIKSILENREFF